MCVLYLKKGAPLHICPFCDNGKVSDMDKPNWLEWKTCRAELNLELINQMSISEFCLHIMSFLLPGSGTPLVYIQILHQNCRVFSFIYSSFGPKGRFKITSRFWRNPRSTAIPLRCLNRQYFSSKRPQIAGKKFDQFQLKITFSARSKKWVTNELSWTNKYYLFEMALSLLDTDFK